MRKCILQIFVFYFSISISEYYHLLLDNVFSHIIYRVFPLSLKHNLESFHDFSHQFLYYKKYFLF